MLSSSLQGYLEIIYKIEKAGQEIKALEIAQELNVQIDGFKI